MLDYVKRKVGVYLIVILRGFPPTSFLFLPCHENFIFLGPATIGSMKECSDVSESKKPDELINILKFSLNNNCSYPLRFFK